ncbi:P-type conjugative transfer protein TrbL [Xanthomonas euvesicatoria]|uniref:P-type conjugative transfer protein TrbL n=1 Tax=Xanthomonas euvesicatoria TaxID=456327 RepID=UPI0038917346
MNPANPSLVQLVQLFAWILQGWMALVAVSLVTLTAVFHRHGTAAELKAPRTLWAMRSILAMCGGRLLFKNTRRHFPGMHDAIFIGNAQPRQVTRFDKVKPWLIVVGLMAAMILLTPEAHAQASPMGDNMLDDTTAFYVDQSKQMSAILKPLAKQLYGLLAVISFALFFLRSALNGSDGPSMFGKFALEIFKAGFFLWVIDVGPEYLMQFMRYFTDAGSKIGQAGQLSPSGIVVLGFDTCFRTFDAIGRMGWGDTAAFGLPLALCGIAILVCFAMVAILLMIRLIEMHMVIYGGILLLGFGGISFTRDIPKNYLSYAISCGAQLFMVYVIVGMGMQLADSWPATLSTSATPDAILRQVMQLGVAALVFASLAWSIPKAAASLVNGSVSMGAADAFAPAGAAAAGAMAGATVASGGTAALAAATKGAMQATTAGTSLARQAGATGLSSVFKGFGNAAGAVASEAKNALQAKAGVKPPSVHAMDGRGRSVDNLGTRAANNLQSQAQAAREAKAGAPETPTGDTSGGQKTDDQAKATGALSIEGSPGATGGGVGIALPPPDTGEQFNGGRGGDNSGRRLSPPQLPPDTAPSSAVSIRTELDD